ncbi:MAG: DUF4301 family protein [Acidobacteriota bacterium]|jgi:hypothetical protein|nr:DUF4301 family protein [Acidobacteriota bacterium]
MFCDRDRAFLGARGISLSDAERQIKLLKRKSSVIVLDRPALVGDGIHRFPPAEADRLATVYEDQLKSVRVTKFVPASGAATRMFSLPMGFLKGQFHVNVEDLTAESPPSSAEAAFLHEFFSGLRQRRFAFTHELDAALKKSGSSLRRALKKKDFKRILSVLLEPRHLGYARLPKALIPFHLDHDTAYTPLHEHLAEALAYGLGRGGVCGVHFTVAPEFESGIRARVDACLPGFPERGSMFRVQYSVQDPATNTLSITVDGDLFRDESGNPLLRPGGHGSLIRNLDGLDTDLAFIKNIDNVTPWRCADASTYWKKVMAGFLLRQQGRIFQLLRQLDGRQQGAAAAAEQYIREVMGQRVPSGLDADAGTRWIRKYLHRPIRVCGMVVNQGEPGGGPFWVRDETGSVSLQIVESAQINHTDPGQSDIAAKATHFNPVDLVCGLRDYQDRKFSLTDFVNAETCFVTSKTRAGRPLYALEWPGLWNGAMHDWLTFFVEIPVKTFTPVKTVNDLLRAGHQCDAPD